jgi:hypothetical protein
VKVDVDHSKLPLVNVVLRNTGQGAARHRLRLLRALRRSGERAGLFRAGMNGQGCIVGAIGDYAAIRQLMADLACEGGEHRTRIGERYYQAAW